MKKLKANCFTALLAALALALAAGPAPGAAAASFRGEGGKERWNKRH